MEMVTATRQAVQARDGLRPAPQHSDAAKQPFGDRIAVLHNYAKIRKKLMHFVERINDALEGRRELGDSDVNDLMHNFTSDGRAITREKACGIIQSVIVELGREGAPVTDAEAVKKIRDVTERVMKEFGIAWVL